MKRKPLPPFARLVRQHAPRNGLRIEAGTLAWERCRKANGDANCLKKFGAASVVFPDDAEPNQYNWSVVAGLEVAISFCPPGYQEFDNPDPEAEQTHAEMSRLDALARELIHGGATRVVVAHPRVPLEVYAPRILGAAA